MNPAPSIIAFTTLSGLGLGLLFWLGIDSTPPTGWVAAVFYGLAFVLTVAGLVSSTFHLGRPERALKAFSQWKTSWLSREAWIAVAALLFAGLHAVLLVFTGQSLGLLGWLSSASAIATVLATSMIYAQLKTVPRWNTWMTPVLFLNFSLAGGALLSGRITTAVVLLLLAAVIQCAFWFWGDSKRARPTTDIASATGLGQIGRVRAFEPPHTGTNYLLREMVFVVARKHALKLRVLAILFMSALPAALLYLPFSHVMAALAVISHCAGVAIARWLFFAEAEHVVGFYYGRR